MRFSDLLLSTALAVVYVWRHLVATRRVLAQRERDEVIVRTQLALAADIQRSLLPQLPGAEQGFDCAALLRRAGTIGGDFYDFVNNAPGVWMVLIADVSGKGIRAAMAIGLLRSTFRALARQPLEPAELSAQLSDALLRECTDVLYVTAIVVSIDVRAHSLTYTNAGHPSGLVGSRTGLRYLDRGGLPLGLLPQARYEQERIPFTAGDCCLLVTDGIREVIVGPKSLERQMLDASERGMSAAALCDAVMSDAIHAADTSLEQSADHDRTVVVICQRTDALLVPMAAPPTSRPRRWNIH
jgi:sigma-B regulation protein RsbU (phosphoserine phosphatase)